MSWAVWCVLRYFAYTKGLDSRRALYFVTALLCCEYPLGKLAKADRYRGFFMSVFHFAMGMGAFVVFVINPIPIKEAYPWLMRLTGVYF
jgi:hypothetical protein